MVPPAKNPTRRTIADWRAEAPSRCIELIDGEFVEKASPDAPHSNAQAGVTTILRGPFHRKRGGAGPGGWWIVTEVDVLLGGDVVRPDVAGWSRARAPVLPT
jgi:Uma2 family endonuclease